MLHPKDYIHPEDAAALRNMEAIPGFGLAVKTFLKLGYERMMRGLKIANNIRLSPEQLPHIYDRLPPLCAKLGIAVPQFYLEMNPMPNAYTFGDSDIFIVVTSGLLEYLDDEEIDAVIAHECGHIACRHVLYHTMASLLLSGSSGMLGTLAAPIRLAMLYWQRKSELSCDRAAALATSVDAVVKTHIRLAGGSKAITEGVNLDSWVAQASEYEEIRDNKLWDKMLQGLAVMNRSHPFSAVRVREILKWQETEQYSRLAAAMKSHESAKKCIKCKNIIDPAWKFCKYCGNQNI